MTAYPGLRAQILHRPDDVIMIGRGRLRIAKDLRAYRRLAAGFIHDLADHDVTPTRRADVRSLLPEGRVADPVVMLLQPLR